MPAHKRWTSKLGHSLIFMAVMLSSSIGASPLPNAGSNGATLVDEETRGCVMFHAIHKSAGVTVLNTLRRPGPDFSTLTPAIWFERPKRVGLDAWRAACLKTGVNAELACESVACLACSYYWGEGRNNNYAFEGLRSARLVKSAKSPNASSEISSASKISVKEIGLVPHSLLLASDHTKNSMPRSSRKTPRIHQVAPATFS